MPRKLRVFLCHASQDKPAVRELYKRLAAESWINPWLDEENLLPGQDFDLEIYKATRDADAIIICLSKVSVVKEGYVNREIRRVLSIYEEKLPGAIYLIPLRLDECEPSFEQLKKLHWVDYFAPNTHEKLIRSLRAGALKIEIPERKTETVIEAKPLGEIDLYRFIEISQTKGVLYPFWIGKYPITNAQYERFLNAIDYDSAFYWLEFPKFDEECKRIGDWRQAGLTWLIKELKKSKSKVLLPRYWEDKDFGKLKSNHPVVGISWYEANAYCKWLFQNWGALPESKANPSLKPQIIRLPLETEWEAAAGGVKPEERYPWNEPGRTTTSLKEILRRANVGKSEIDHTTPVNTYPSGKSPFGVMDMAGNVLEWQANFYDNDYDNLGLRGGSWDSHEDDARTSIRVDCPPDDEDDGIGFRVIVSLHNR
jgi:formylglycine-generating enzyme required for sulfatase activity